ncbi:putative DNA-binding domain-containing protein [Undibacterium sp. TC4M20W]|uniref:HvfC/BufC family peptide modification chaperone n=1 Tax=Undibacterium sp. TC4M20W TaxID=3413052 RepID=UPI003BF1F301
MSTQIDAAMDALSLSEIQSQFAQALLQPSSAAQTATLFNAHPHQDDRLALYRGNLTAIWTSALKNAFPVLYQLVGEDYFEQLVRVFGRAFPSESGDLNQFGAKLAAFLKTIPDAADYPYFSDVAALEWQIHCAYYAADAEALSLTDLLQAVAAPGQDVQTVRLLFHPAASLYTAELDSVAIWLAHQVHTEAGFPENIRQACHGLVSRPQWSVELHRISKASFLALTALQQGSNLGTALEIALDTDSEFDINAQLQFWFASGLFANFKFPENQL